MAQTVRVSLNEESQSVWQSRNLEHLRYDYDLQPSDTVIDIGAYRGEWAREIRARYGCVPIVIEPTDSIDGYDGEIIKRAAWTHEGALVFGGAYYYTSLYEAGGSYGGNVREIWGKHSYSCFDINDLLARFDEIALVKINIEGAEYVLLDHIIRHDYHIRIRNLQVQFHQLAPEPYAAWYSGIAGRLRASHFCEWRYSFCWENWRRI